MNLNEQQKSPLIITKNTSDNLLISAKWTKLIGIIGIVTLGLILILLLLTIFMARGGAQGEALLSLLGFLVLSILYIFPLMFLLKYANKLKRGLMSSNQVLVDDGFNSLKSLHKYTGVITLIFVILEGIAFLSLMVSLILR